MSPLSYKILKVKGENRDNTLILVKLFGVIVQCLVICHSNKGQ